jgi:hypothetical protein
MTLSRASARVRPVMLFRRWINMDCGRIGGKSPLLRRADAGVTA